MAQNNEKHRQFIISMAGNIHQYPDISLLELEILAKLKVVFDEMTVGKTLAPADFAFLGSRS